MVNIFIATSSLIEGVSIAQADTVEAIRDAGADGIEIREELFGALPGFAELSALKRRCQAVGLAIHYSSPQPLWRSDGLPNAGLKPLVSRAVASGATLVKVPLGDVDLDAIDKGALMAAGQWLASLHDAPLLTVENDQTQQGGAARQLMDFFRLCGEYRAPVRMTFDLGNWSSTREDTVTAARMLAAHVAYIHVKSPDQGAHPQTSRAFDIGASDSGTVNEALAVLPPDCPRCIEYSLVGRSTDAMRQQVTQLRRQPGGGAFS